MCIRDRRYTAKKGYEVAVALPPLNYGGHPYHHIGMPGTVIMSEEVVRETPVSYTHLPELLGIADRIYVMKDGEITGEVSREEDKFTQEAILHIDVYKRQPTNRLFSRKWPSVPGSQNFALPMETIWTISTSW